MCGIVGYVGGQDATGIVPHRPFPVSDEPVFPLAIGHTRWATHGPPTPAGARPHLSQAGTIVAAVRQAIG